MVAIKRRLVSIALIIVTVFTLFPMTQAHAAEDWLYGGQEIAWENLPVYSDRYGSSRIGTIYKYEGFTVLRDNFPERYWWVEYSTSSGPKRGYLVFEYGDEVHQRKSGLATVKSTTSLYYGTNTYDYQKSGTVYAGEYVTIMAKNDDWVYVEYNTTSGRKRGYMSYSNLNVINRPGVFYDLFTFQNMGQTKYYSGRYNVYAGPTSQYSVVGYIENENVIEYANEWLEHGEMSTYIEYYVNGTNQKKSGFIVWDA